MKHMTLNAMKRMLSQPLPGAASHRIMWPEGREEIPLEDLYPAATMILIYTLDKRQYFPLIRRSNREDDAHRGQIGLPGGHHEPGESYLETAIRETEEEIGVQIKPQEIAGKLSPLAITRSGFIVHPYVALTEDALTFKPDPAEVDEVIPVSLEELLRHPENKTFKLDNGWNVPGFLFSNVNVWGATAMILNEFRVMSLE
jgi:8-oxo-dGTP pyrophosphatase MutT (NUDIX family)